MKYSNLFLKNHLITIKKPRDLSSARIDDILKRAEKDPAPVVRYEACIALKRRYTTSTPREKAQIEVVFQSLRRKQVACIPIPYTGDPDCRIRKIASEFFADI